jgi:hypothetical protein
MGDGDDDTAREGDRQEEADHGRSLTEQLVGTQT